MPQATPALARVANRGTKSPRSPKRSKRLRKKGSKASSLSRSRSTASKLSSRQSRSPSRNLSPSRSRNRSRNPSRSRSRNPSRSRSRSPSRKSRSKSPSRSYHSARAKPRSIESVRNSPQKSNANRSLSPSQKSVSWKSPSPSLRTATSKKSVSRDKSTGQSSATTSYFVDGEPATDPQVKKFLEKLFNNNYSTKTGKPASGNHPQQFTQIFIPEHQNAIMTQPSDYEMLDGGSQGSKVPYIVFNNTIENHGHLVLNQGHGKNGQMIAGDAPEMTENSGYLEESAHQFTEEKYINLPGGPDNTDHPYYDNNGAFVGGQDESKNGILDGPDDLDNPNDESKSGRLGDPEDPDNPYLDGSGSIQKLEISNLDAEEATQEQMTQDIQMIEGGQQKGEMSMQNDGNDHFKYTMQNKVRVSLASDEMEGEGESGEEGVSQYFEAGEGGVTGRPPPVPLAGEDAPYIYTHEQTTEVKCATDTDGEPETTVNTSHKIYEGPPQPDSDQEDNQGHEAEPEAYDVPEGEDYEDEYEGNAYEGEDGYGEGGGEEEYPEDGQEEYYEAEEAESAEQYADL